MRTSKQLQRERRQQLDEKLALSHPSNELLEDLAAQCTKDPSADHKFQYAFALSKSSNEQELHYSIAMLDSLLNSGYEHQIDCMYGSAIARYLLGEYDKSRNICEAILRNRPENVLAAELHTSNLSAKDDADEKKVKQIAVGGTVAVAALGVAALILGGAGKKRS